MSEEKKYQASKSTSNKRLRKKRDVSYSLPHSEFLGIASTFSGLVLSLLFGITIYNNTSASSISVSVSGDMNLDLLASNDGMFGTSSASNISVRSTNAAGYTLTLTRDNSDGKLVGTSNDHYFTNIGNSLTREQFDTSANNGKWGIFPSKYQGVANTTNYYPAPTSATPVNIDTTNVANNTPNTYTLAIAARAATGAGSTTPADTYSGTMTLAATGNAIDYDIAYADANNGMPGLTHGASTTGYAAVSDATPTREGYTFGGWCTVSVLIGESCTAKGGEVKAAGSNYTLNGTGDNNVTLYAIWNPITFAAAGATTMQSMTPAICNAVAIGQEGTLTDTRGGTYRVGKMKDGRCWMLDNLALGRVQLTPDNTNISANYIFPTDATTWSIALTEAKINTASNSIIPQGDDPLKKEAQDGQWKVGTYYNYCAATAGTYCPAEGTVTNSLAQDICPKGWRLPSSGSGGEFQALYVAYGNNYTSFRNALHLPLSGDIISGQGASHGEIGYWWSSSLHNSNSMYHLYANITAILPSVSNSRGNGFSVRCIAK